MDDLSKVEILESIDNNILDWGVRTIKAPQVWSKSKGEGVKVMVIDTGIDMNHPDLKHAFKFGMNMIERTNDVTDEYGHGTHVAGLIAGKHTGVAPNVELYITKVLDDKGFGSMTNVMDGITFAINCEVDILCMSLGISNGLPLILQQRIIQAYEAGVTIVCATGNSGFNEPEYPAFMNEVIAVGGLNRDLERASFSNYGERMDILAPSTEILSTYKDSNYCRMSGTSMASPLIAGGIALIISYYRKKGIELKPFEIKEMLSKLEPHNGHKIMDLTKLMD